MNRRLRHSSLFLCIFLLLCFTRPLLAQDQGWEKKLEARTEALKQKNGEGTDQALKSELLQMRDTDQDIRKRWIEAPQDKKGALATEMTQVDKDLTQKLEEIVATKGWPTIRLVGMEASSVAGMILTHSADHEFQRKMLSQLQKLVDDDQIAGDSVALITDKLLVSESKPQRFGTQFNIQNGKLVMLPTEDPGHLQERRAKYLLPPLDEYRKVLSDTYHMPVQ